MTTIFCSTCGKEFARAAQLKVHGERKRPGKPPVVAAAATATATSEPFRPASVTFNKSLPKEVRQATGIFFTPKKVRDLLFEKLGDLHPTRILEPSFGTGEFLFDAGERYPAAKLTGIEMNKELFLSTAKQFAGATHVNLTNGDFLAWSGTADLIIGNPPYFVVPASDSSVMATGRPNIYIQFLHKCLAEHLEPNGHLAFIIPTSIYNCAYYQPMRDYIAAHTTILHVETLDKPGFYETTQETTLLILQKTVTSDPQFLFRSVSGNLYISPYYKELYELTAGSTTLRALGLAVKTGNVVWNQVKEKLTAIATEEKAKLLVYASNIKNSTLTLNNLLGTEKKQYVKDLTKPTLDGPVILVDRGYGNAVSFNSVLMTQKDFYAENHLNVIYRHDGSTPEQALTRAAASLKDDRTVQFVTLFNGNGTLSATDLETLIPIF